jgi:hypothetical protein
MHLLERISDSGISGGDLSFANGLTGVGWAIEWLAQNDLMEETNTDEVLEPIDDILFNTVTYVKDANLSLFNGTLGKVAYFLKRATSQNPGTHRYKTIGHLECIVLLLDDLADKINDPWKPEDNLTELGNILCYISSIRVKVNSPTSGKILYNSINQAEGILSILRPDTFPTADSQKEGYLDLLYLAVCYLIAADNKYNKHWQMQALTHIENIDSVLDGLSEFTMEQLFRMLSLYLLIQISHPTQKLKAKITELIAVLSPMNLPPSIVNGRGTLVIAELSLANPALVPNWNEIILFG